MENNVKKTVLENGLTVITERVEKIQSLSIGMWIKTGSRNETDHQAGITHLLEHMLFKGTDNRSAHNIALSMESVGGSINAFTTLEHTCFFARCLNKHLAKAVDVLSDMLLRPSLLKEEIEKEKKFILDKKKKKRDNPKDYVLDRFMNVVFNGHPLGRSILGHKESVAKLNKQDLCNYMSTHYGSDNIIIAAAGDLSHDEVVSIVKESFLGFNSPSKINYNPVIPPYQKQSEILQNNSNQTHLVIGRRGLSIKHDDRFKLLLINTILGVGMSSLLHQNIRDTYGYCYSINSTNRSFKDTGVFSIYAGTSSDYTNRVEELILKETHKIKSNPVPKTILESAKTKVKGSLLLSLENMTSRMQRLVKTETYFGRFITLTELITNIESITAQEIQKFATTFLDETLFSKTILTPEENWPSPAE